jgi:hypothetical protein
VISRFDRIVFPAISGLAREHDRQTGHSYIAGIWKENIHQGLLWRTADTVLRITEAYHAPSWSWASIASNINDDIYPHHTSTQEDAQVGEKAALISWEVILKDNDPFGCLTSGFIHLRGRCLLARDWQGKTEPFFNFNKEIRTEISCKFPSQEDGLAMEMNLSEKSDQLRCNFDLL